MAYETAIIIAVPMVIEALSKFLNIKKEQLQEYYDTSQAFRDYINSLTNSFNSDVQTELMQVTPSTTPRFDIPWVTEELKKKQHEILNIKKEITDIQTKAYQSSQETFKNSPEHFEGSTKVKHHGLGSFFTDPMGKARDKFNQRKKKESDAYTKQTANLHDKMNGVVRRPLKNNNPTYQSIQERKKNARLSKEKEK